MNNSSFTRKIIYITIIAGLLIPLSLVSRPATRNVDDDKLISGGKLAVLRDKYELSQAKLTEIDPASETMKLASLGLRGVAVNMLWMQAMEHKKKENWDQLESTLNALVKIQPNFIKVWEYQAHNMSYNISMEFDDYEYRYHWVKKGIYFLTKGLGPNYRDHRMNDNLGFFTGMKFGVSDEKRQYRRMFRGDEDFHSDMAGYVEPDDYDTEYGHDHWKMAYHWYNRSRNLVENQSAPQFSNDIMFYMKRPAQLRNLGGALQEEFRSDEAIREIWSDAHDEWMDYGRRSLGNRKGQVVSLESLVKTNEELERKRAELDALAPEGTRQQMMAQQRSLVEVSDEEQAAMDIPSDQRTDEQESLARRAHGRLSLEMVKVDAMVASQIPEADQIRARRIGDEITMLMEDIRTIDRYQGTINYRYWRIRTKAEMTERAVRARQLMYDAQELSRKSIFDDEYEVDPETGEKKVVQKGAISSYEDCYEMFDEMIKNYPKLTEGELADELVESMVIYQDMLKVTGLEWPDDFPLQDFVDSNAEENFEERLPTSDELEERRLERGEDPEMENETDIEEGDEAKSDTDTSQPENDAGYDEGNEVEETNAEKGDGNSTQEDAKKDVEKSDDNSDEKTTKSDKN